MHRFSKEVKLFDQIISIVHGFNQIKIKHFSSVLSIIHMAPHVTQRMDEMKDSYQIYPFFNVPKTIQNNAKYKIGLTGAGEMMAQEVNTPFS